MIKRNFLVSFLLLMTMLMITLASCDPSRKYVKEEKAKIQDYLGSNSDLNFELKPTGLYYLETHEGTGLALSQHDTAYVKYTGKFLDGTIFDSNTATSTYLIFPIGEGWVINGFDEGISYMKEGGKATLLIPSELAYGPNGSGYSYDPSYGYYQAIPGYTPLLFDVELVQVRPSGGK
jgi:FKBP-type peptidyl-prolyl cis-trans isomerase FkpA